MKKTILFVALLMLIKTVSAQFYGSLSLGATLKANEQNLGAESNLLNGTSNDLDGSYGEGFNGQLKGGYFFNETIGLELGVGYLYGANQDLNELNFGDTNLVDMYARGRAFGASLSAVVNVTKNVYTRIGLLTKIGGKTEAVTSLVLPNTLTGIGADINADFKTDFHGKFPLGFVGAIGYKYKITEKISLFAEVEYFNIGVTRDESSLASFSGTIGGNELSSSDLFSIVNTSENENLNRLSFLLLEDVQWGEGGLPAPKAPYSSIGLNFGAIYNF